MKRWERYKDYLHRGDWHVHTSYTDGKNTVFEYCEKAEKLGLELIAFTEHVRKELSYNFEDFMSDIYSARDKFDLIVLGGCEAKVLDLEGNLDVSEEVLRHCEVVLGVFHSFPFGTKADYLKALKHMLRNPNVDIWAHPTLFAEKNKFELCDVEIKRIIEECKNNRVLIEKNMRYNLPNERFMDILIGKKWNFTIGSDAHTTKELRNMASYSIPR